MASTPLSSPVGLMSVSTMLASIGQNITGGCATTTDKDMGTQLNFEEEETGFAPANSEMMLPFKAEQEGGLGTYGLPGGGARQCRCYFLLRKTMITFFWVVLDVT
jgi:hypothetical protein